VKASSNSNPGMAQPTYRGATGIAHETELIARIAEGDRKAFEELYYLYHRRLARFLTRLTRRYDIAEEVVNDTFWVVWRKAKSFRGDSQPSTWILGIAYRKARNAFRSTARLAEKNLEPELLPHTDEEPAGTEELRDWLTRALAELPVEQRLAVELCYELGHSCEEIATIMDCPVNTVKTRLFHARGKLQRLLPQLATPTSMSADRAPLQGSAARPEHKPS
jgi:RNA polymerase sigma-70 factor, ECF subfamily